MSSLNDTIKSFVNESNDLYYDYLDEYDCGYVFSSFLSDISNGIKKQDWSPLINPSMYKKALMEFSKYGKLVNFPTKYVYQWMGIIMKNTAILVANTEIAGHSNSFPDEECESFLDDYFGDGRYIRLRSSDDCIIQLTDDECYNLCRGKLDFLIKEAVDSKGQNYMDFMSQNDIDSIDMADKKNKWKNDNTTLINLIDEYNKKSIRDSYIDIDYDNLRFLWHCSVYDILDYIGLFDWMSMPDGSDAFSDFGISPLYEIIDEYDEDLAPEKVLVLVNRALDVYHQRGDLSSIFIVGGESTLNKISESINKFNNKSGNIIRLNESDLRDIVLDVVNRLVNT